MNNIKNTGISALKDNYNIRFVIYITYSKKIVHYQLHIIKDRKIFENLKKNKKRTQNIGMHCKPVYPIDKYRRYVNNSKKQCAFRVAKHIIIMWVIIE